MNGGFITPLGDESSMRMEQRKALCGYAHGKCPHESFWRRCMCTYFSGQYEWKDNSPASDRALEGTSGGKAISFNGSVHVPSSADTPLLSKTTSTGSMTSCFFKAIKDGHKQTYGSILDSMHNTINPTGGNLRQEPLLSACGQFDVNSKIFTL
ncbi:hypothetical protein MRB53_027136 [Persea americana]|uniref:Uncharacterized protein n=1 Tax=Persea americana TaxID=3435 RepID=A0ACC2LKJ4_PERAE|nr:hypothetical protein MRB53_027136 [Persea americana]